MILCVVDFQRRHTSSAKCSMNLRSALLDHVRSPLHCHQYPPITEKRTQDGAHERLLGMRDKVAKCCLDAERLRGRYMEECLWCCISWKIACEWCAYGRWLNHKSSDGDFQLLSG